MSKAATTLAGELSLPLMRRFREALSRRGVRVRGQPGEGPVWSREWEEGSDPEVVLSLGYERVFGRSFLARGEYRAVEVGPLRDTFRQSGLADPCGRVTAFAGTPFVLLVDHRRLGPLPVPRRWEDLLEKDYAGEIMAPGGELGISSVVLLHYASRHGLEAMRRFASQVRGCAHGSRVARSAREDAVPAALAIVPWIYAQCVRGVDVEVVWPEEGAIFSPMWMAAREDASQEALELADFFAGPGFGEEAGAFLCPWASREVSDILPEGARLAWCGWDFLDSVDLEAYSAHLRLEARRARHKARERR